MATRTLESDAGVRVARRRYLLVPRSGGTKGDFLVFQGTPAFIFRLIISPMPEARSSLPSSVRLDRQDPYLGLFCVNIFVRNLDRSLRFYLGKVSSCFNVSVAALPRFVAMSIFFIIINASKALCLTSTIRKRFG